MLNNISPAAMRVMLVVWICTLIVTVIEIIRIYRKSRAAEKRLFRRSEGANVREDIFERTADKACGPEAADGREDAARLHLDNWPHLDNAEITLEPGRFFPDYDGEDGTTEAYEPSAEELAQFIRLEFQEISGEPSERLEVIRQRVNYLGRSGKRCNICVEDPYISAVHAVLTCEGGTISIKNYGVPKNAVFVDGRALIGDEAAKLRDGAQVRIANTSLIVRTQKSEEDGQRAEP